MTKCRGVTSGKNLKSVQWGSMVEGIRVFSRFIFIKRKNKNKTSKNKGSRKRKEIQCENTYKHTHKRLTMEI